MYYIPEAKPAIIDNDSFRVVCRKCAKNALTYKNEHLSVFYMCEYSRHFQPETAEDATEIPYCNFSIKILSGTCPKCGELHQSWIYSGRILPEETKVTEKWYEKFVRYAERFRR